MTLEEHTHKLIATLNDLIIERNGILKIQTGYTDRLSEINQESIKVQSLIDAIDEYLNGE